MVVHRRVGVVAVGDPRDPTIWSGTPRGLFDGLGAADVDVVPINAMPERVLRLSQRARIAAMRRLKRQEHLSLSEALAAAYFGPEWSAVLAATAMRQLRRAKVEAVIQASDAIGPLDRPTAIFQDMTVRQELGVRQFQPRFDITHLDKPRDQAAQRIADAAQALCPATPWAASSLITDYSQPSEKVHAVGIGCRLEASPKPDKDWSVPKFLFVASRWERKNGPTVVDAFGKLRAHYPNAELHLVGDQPHLELPGVHCHGILARNNDADQRKLRSLYASATCLVVPGQFEAAGIVFVEAARWAIPSIGATVGGSSDIIGPGGTAVPPGDTDALLVAMLSMSEPGHAHEVGRIGERRSHLFTWPLVARRMLNALNIPACSAQDDGLWTT